MYYLEPPGALPPANGAAEGAPDLRLRFLPPGPPSLPPFFPPSPPVSSSSLPSLLLVFPGVALLPGVTVGGVTAGGVGVIAGTGAGDDEGGVSGAEGGVYSPLPAAGWSVVSSVPLGLVSSSAGSSTTSMNEGGGGGVTGAVASAVGTMVVAGEGDVVVLDTTGGEVVVFEGALLVLPLLDDDDGADVGVTVLVIVEGLLVGVVCEVGLKDGCVVEVSDDAEGVVGCMVGATVFSVARGGHIDRRGGG